MSTLVLDLTNLSEVLWYLNGGRVKTVLLFVTPFTFQLSLHLERGTHHAYQLCLGC